MKLVGMLGASAGTLQWPHGSVSSEVCVRAMGRRPKIRHTDRGEPHGPRQREDALSCYTASTITIASSTYCAGFVPGYQCYIRSRCPDNSPADHEHSILPQVIRRELGKPWPMATAQIVFPLGGFLDVINSALEMRVLWAGMVGEI